LFAYFILFGGESNCLERLVFLHHCNEDQKIDPYVFEKFRCFYPVVENCLFSINLSGESDCLNPFTLFLQNSERCNQSASTSFALFDEISQKTCAIQR